MTRRSYARLAVTAALVLAGTTACTDTTVEPKSSVTETNVFSTPASYQQFLAKVYAGLAVTGQQGPAGNRDIEAITDEGFSSYLRLYWKLQELSSDEAVIAWGDQGLPELVKQEWGSSNRFVAGMFSRVYFQVMMANEFLRQTTDDKLASRGVSASLRATIQGYRAEARFLRALSYWHGMDLFGNIPLVTEADGIGATPPRQATRAQIFDFLVSELTAIKTDLPAPAPGNPALAGRATSAAADMLLAELYLNAQVYTGTPRWAEARAAAEAVIGAGFQLAPDYRDNFRADNNTSPEMVFSVVQDGVHTKSYGGTTFLMHASCGNSMVSSDYGFDGCWYGLRLKPEAYNRYDFESSDSRTSFFYTNGQTVQIADIGTFGNGIPAPKFINKTKAGAAGSDPVFSDVDFPVFRLAEAYLIYAEAFLRGGGGDQGTALGYVNAIRERAYGDNSGDILANQLTLQFVLDERSRELLWEGHRRTDLVRFGVFTGGAYIWSWKGGTQGGIATDSHLDLFPIPVDQLSANPNLTQNPGY